MDLTHHIRVPASLDDTWAVFARPERLAPCFPGATITAADGDDFTGSIKIKLGPLALVYEGAGRYIKRDEDLRRLEIEFHGQDLRGHGAAEGTVRAAFTAAGAVTEIEVDTELTITGKPEQFGPSVLSDVNDRILDQFASCIAGRFTDGSIHDSEPEAGQPVAGGTGSDSVGADRAGSDGSGGSSDRTVEVGEVPGEVEGTVPGEPKLGPPKPSSSASAASAGAARQAPSQATATGGPQVWVPASNLAETDLEVITRVLPPLLKRYWPFLGGAGVAALVATKIAGRKNKKKKRR